MMPPSQVREVAAFVRRHRTCADPFDLAHWQTPAPFDSEPWQVTSQTATEVRFRKRNAPPVRHWRYRVFQSSQTSNRNM